MLRNILIIASLTLRELLKSKVLYSIFILASIISILAVISSEFTFGVPSRVALDVGLGLVSLSCCAIALFFGLDLIALEIESRTLYMILSRPVRRFEFLIGKIKGLGWMLVINWLILGLIVSGIIYYLGGVLDAQYFITLGFVLLESCLVLMLTVCCSLIMNKVLAFMTCLSLYTIGHALSSADLISFIKMNPFIHQLIKIYEYIFPLFYKLNFKDYLLYNQALETSIYWKSLAYGYTYMFFLLLLSCLLFSKKSLD